MADDYNTMNESELRSLILELSGVYADDSMGRVVLSQGILQCRFPAGYQLGRDEVAGRFLP